MDESPRGALTADLSFIRYAQCWEDADVLLSALDVQPGDTCLSIGSGGENSLSLLTRDPARVIVVELSRVQIACLELKAACYRRISHPELLELYGATISARRSVLYAQVRGDLSAAARAYWDAHPHDIEAGIGAAGKFERYFALFRRYVLPLIHTRRTIDALFQPHTLAERQRYYTTTWNNWRWRLLFGAFVSRPVLGWLGRDPSFFRYVVGQVAGRIMAQVRHALTDLDPAQNPYLQWIVYGRFQSALPHALRPEHFATIRDRLDRLEWRLGAVEDIVEEAPPASIDRFNLSDVFEYLPPDQADDLFERIARAGRAGGRLAYWNMLAPRRPPAVLASTLRPLDELSRRLHAQAQTCFYNGFFVEEFAR